MMERLQLMDAISTSEAGFSSFQRASIAAILEG